MLAAVVYCLTVKSQAATDFTSALNPSKGSVLLKGQAPFFFPFFNYYGYTLISLSENIFSTNDYSCSYWLGVNGRVGFINS